MPRRSAYSSPCHYDKRLVIVGVTTEFPVVYHLLLHLQYRFKPLLFPGCPRRFSTTSSPTRSRTTVHRKTTGARIPPPLPPRRSSCAWVSSCTPSHRAYTDGERLPDVAQRGEGGTGVSGRSTRPRNRTADRREVPSWIGQRKKKLPVGRLVIEFECLPRGLFSLNIRNGHNPLLS